MVDTTAPRSLILTAAIEHWHCCGCRSGHDKCRHKRGNEPMKLPHWICHLAYLLE
jgi:hypothetical protein